MKKTAQVVAILAVFLFVTAGSAMARGERTSISDNRAVQIAKKQVRGKLVDVERESDMIEVRIAKKNDIIEIYIDSRTGEVMMIESHMTEFESGEGN